MPGLERILALTPIPSVVLTPDLGIVELSQSYLGSTGLRREECIGVNIYDFFSDKVRGPDAALVRTGIRRAVELKSPYTLDGRLEASSLHWCGRVIPIYDEDELLYLVLEEQMTDGARTVATNDQSYANETYRILVNNVKDYAIFMVDTEGYVTTWNAGASIAKQYDAEEIIGKHVSIFYGEEDRAAGRPQGDLEYCMRHGRHEAEGWRYRKDATKFWASVIIAPVYRFGQHVGFSKVTRDLTERKAAQGRLIAAYEEASKLKSDFLANMSHEIRWVSSNAS